MENNIIQFFKKKASERECRKGTVSRALAYSKEDEFADRLERIKASLKRINLMMCELKEKSNKQ